MLLAFGGFAIQFRDLDSTQSAQRLYSVLHVGCCCQFVPRLEVQTMAVFYIVFPYMLPWLKAVKRRRLMIHLLFWLQAATFLSIASRLH